VDVDTLIHADWVVTVDAQDRVLSQHSLAITQGRIAVIAPRTETYGIKARETIKLTGHALIPGLINAHTHAAMSLLRGLADDLPLMTWLQDHIWPAEGRWANADFVHDGTQLALLEMLRGGTTCFNDMYFFPDVTAELVNAAGMRASIGLIIVDFPSVWAKDATNYFAKGCTVHDRFAQHPRIRTTLAPHAPYSVSNSSLIQVATLAEELDVQIHIHLHETQDEIQQSVKTYGLRPLARLQKLGIVSPRLIAVHMTQLEAYSTLPRIQS
jgi:5-methylthioadenosine/S-adenosylhomocysteine deaminase